MAQSEANDSELEISSQQSPASSAEKLSDSAADSGSSHPLSNSDALFATLDLDQIKKPEAAEIPVAKAAKVISAKPIPVAAPVASSIPPKLPTAEITASSAPSGKIRSRWRGTPAATPVVEHEIASTKATDPAVAIELRDSEPFRFSDLFSWRGIRQHLGFMISLWIHLVLLALLSLVVVNAGIGDSPLSLEAFTAPADSDEDIFDVVELDSVDLELPAAPEENVLDQLFEEQVAEEDSLKDAVKTLKDLQQGSGAATASNSGGKERGDGKSATFFGTKAAGRRFVFVVDRSTSMRNGSRNFRSNEMFNRYDVATSELLSAVASLQPHQEFFVLMFARNTIPMFSDRRLEESGQENFRMVPATDANKLRLQDWVESLPMGPGTDPRRSIEVAIDMQPDAIFMLSDGQFSGEMRGGGPKTLDIVRNHVRDQTIVPINTISLVVEDTIPMMQEIAKRSGGEFRFTGLNEHTEQIANLRGPMRVRAISQLINSSTDWASRKKLMTDNLIPMLSDHAATERVNAESLLDQATMGLLEGNVVSVLQDDKLAIKQWNEIIREIDGFDKTGQLTALDEVDGDQQLLLHVALEENLSDDQLYRLLNKLDLETLSNLTMIELLHTIQRFHVKFGTTSESIGWTRFLIARLDGKRVKAGPKPATTVWDVAKAKEQIDKLFQSRREAATKLYAKFNDKDRNQRTRERLGNSIVEKYPETQQAITVRQVLDKVRLQGVRVSAPNDTLDPFAP